MATTQTTLTTIAHHIRSGRLDGYRAVSPDSIDEAVAASLTCSHCGVSGLDCLAYRRRDLHGYSRGYATFVLCRECQHAEEF